MDKRTGKKIKVAPVAKTPNDGTVAAPAELIPPKKRNK